jgi:hypothetical protein
MTLDILESSFTTTTNLLIMTNKQKIDEVNIVAVATVAYGGFLRSGEFTYEAKDLQDKRAFASTSLLRSDITFGDVDEHVILSLKRSKTDYDHVGVDIVIATTGNSTCPVRALRRLFKEDSQPMDSPLFRLSLGALLYNKFFVIVRS